MDVLFSQFWGLGLWAKHHDKLFIQLQDSSEVEKRISGEVRMELKYILDLSA